MEMKMENEMETGINIRVPKFKHEAASCAPFSSIMIFSWLSWGFPC